MKYFVLSLLALGLVACGGGNEEGPAAQFLKENDIGGTYDVPDRLFACDLSEADILDSAASSNLFVDIDSGGFRARISDTIGGTGCYVDYKGDFGVDENVEDQLFVENLDTDLKSGCTLTAEGAALYDLQLALLGLLFEEGDRISLETEGDILYVTNETSGACGVLVKS